MNLEGVKTMKINKNMGIFIVIFYFIVCAIVANLYELATIINYKLCAIGLLLALLFRYLYSKSIN